MISYTGMKKFSITCFIALVAFVVIIFGDDSDLLNQIDYNNLPSSLNASELPNIEEGEKQIKEKCMKNGGNTSYDDFLIAKDETLVCLKGLLNYTELKKEIDDAKPNGELDTVFRKYCKKSPTLKGCISNLTTAVEPCLEESEKSLKDTVQNITEALLNFICYKEGDKIALFIAEGGPSCISEKHEAIQTCLNTTLRKYISSDLSEETALPLLKLGEQECLDVYELQTCLVKELGKCEEPTPANIIDSLFEFVYKQTPCSKVPKVSKDGSTTKSVASSLHVFIHVCVLAFSIRLWS